MTENERYVNIEGPEHSLDFSFFLVNMLAEFQYLERGINIVDPDNYGKKSSTNSQSSENKDEPEPTGKSDLALSNYFSQKVESRMADLNAEFILLNKITFHEDHAKHLLYLKLTENQNCPETIVSHVKEVHSQQNRHHTLLPYWHS